MPIFCDSIIDSKPFNRHESEYTEMALKDIILPITEFGQGNIGVKDINIGFPSGYRICPFSYNDTYTSNMISYKEPNILIAVPVYNHSLEEAIPCVEGVRLY